MNLNYKPSGGSLSEMNLTPLVDVMMVLMIIFMVTSSMDPAGIDLDLPDTDTPTVKKETDMLTIYMERNGTVTLSRGPKVRFTTKLSGVTALLSERFPGVKEANIKGDKDLTYQKIMTLLVNTRKAGVTKLGLLMDQVKENDTTAP